MHTVVMIVNIVECSNTAHLSDPRCIKLVLLVWLSLFDSGGKSVNFDTLAEYSMEEELHATIR
jgi:hypothetical protein